MLLAMPDATRILSQFEQGDPQAAEKLLPLVYDELRKLAAAKLAHEKPGQTLQATALVHEAYVRLVGRGKGGQRSGDSGAATSEENPSSNPCSKSPYSFPSRIHFFAAAAEAMRRILIDRAREKRASKRGGNLTHAAISTIVGRVASVKVAQELARHSTPALTIGRYSHVRSRDIQIALDSLPLSEGAQHVAQQLVHENGKLARHSGDDSSYATTVGAGNSPGESDVKCNQQDTLTESGGHGTRTRNPLRGI